jgi:hypothetical protein
MPNKRSEQYEAGSFAILGVQVALDLSTVVAGKSEFSQADDAFGQFSAINCAHGMCFA